MNFAGLSEYIKQFPLENTRINNLEILKIVLFMIHRSHFLTNEDIINGEWWLENLPLFSVAQALQKLYYARQTMPRYMWLWWINGLLRKSPSVWDFLNNNITYDENEWKNSHISLTFEMPDYKTIADALKDDLNEPIDWDINEKIKHWGFPKNWEDFTQHPIGNNINWFFDLKIQSRRQSLETKSFHLQQEVFLKTVKRYLKDWQYGLPLQTSQGSASFMFDFSWLLFEYFIWNKSTNLPIKTIFLPNLYFIPYSFPVFWFFRNFFPIYRDFTKLKVKNWPNLLVQQDFYYQAIFSFYKPWIQYYLKESQIIILPLHMPGHVFTIILNPWTKEVLHFDSAVILQHKFFDKELIFHALQLNNIIDETWKWDPILENSIQDEDSGCTIWNFYLPVRYLSFYLHNRQTIDKMNNDFLLHAPMPEIRQHAHLLMGSLSQTLNACMGKDLKDCDFKLVYKNVIKNLYTTEKKPWNLIKKKFNLYSYRFSKLLNVSYQNGKTPQFHEPEVEQPFLTSILVWMAKRKIPQNKRRISNIQYKKIIKKLLKFHPIYLLIFGYLIRMGLSTKYIQILLMYLNLGIYSKLFHTFLILTNK